MKQKDVIAQRILSIGIAIGVIFLSAGFFISSINTTYANESNPQNKFDFPKELDSKTLSDISSGNGRYMAQFQAFYEPNSAKQQAYIFVWDTQTGKSKIYKWRSGESGFKAISNSGYQPSVIP